MVKPCPLWMCYRSIGQQPLPCRGRTVVHRPLRAPGHFWQLMSVITFCFTQFPFQRDSKSPAVGLGLDGTQIQVLLCFSNSKTGKLAEVPAVLIRASVLSPRCAMQCGQPSMKPLSLAIARGTAGLKDTDKWQRGIASDCWTDYHCSKRFMGCF